MRSVRSLSPEFNFRDNIDEERDEWGLEDDEWGLNEPGVQSTNLVA